MNRIQFWILTAASILVIIVVALQLIFARQAQTAQARVVAAQQVVERGNACATRLHQLAMRVYQVGQQTHDRNLVDLLSRHGFSVSSAPSIPTPAPTPESPASPATPANP